MDRDADTEARAQRRAAEMSADLAMAWKVSPDAGRRQAHLDAIRARVEAEARR